ncbi:hypothetical protein M5K25_003915 [Dendrobium thyrsiflorum]|uniref:Uncharacterized protein n=1 Tax=Dendrobium thyrsiflorum TaxID=117978 RepID=A0ABD0VLD0_DENTH
MPTTSTQPSTPCADFDVCGGPTNGPYTLFSSVIKSSEEMENYEVLLTIGLQGAEFLKVEMDIKRCLISCIRTAPCSILMKVPLGGGTYSRDSILVDEKKDISLPDKDLPACSSQRNPEMSDLLKSYTNKTKL